MRVQDRHVDALLLPPGEPRRQERGSPVDDGDPVPDLPDRPPPFGRLTERRVAEPDRLRAELHPAPGRDLARHVVPGDAVGPQAGAAHDEAELLGDPEHAAVAFDGGLGP